MELLKEGAPFPWSGFPGNILLAQPQFYPAYLGSVGGEGLEEGKKAQARYQDTTDH